MEKPISSKVEEDLIWHDSEVLGQLRVFSIDHLYYCSHNIALIPVYTLTPTTYRIKSESSPLHGYRIC